MRWWIVAVAFGAVWTSAFAFLIWTRLRGSRLVELEEADDLAESA